MKKKLILDPHLDQIRQLAAQGKNCPEIVKELNVPVNNEQMRLYLQENNIPLLAKRGAQPGEKHRDWKGGRTVDKSGYVLVQCPDHPYANHAGYVREHRLVIETDVHRFLLPSEVVHHINGINDDNRLENLQLFQSNAEHLRHELTGKVPNWTEEGWSRILEGCHLGGVAVAGHSRNRKRKSDL